MREKVSCYEMISGICFGLAVSLSLQRRFAAGNMRKHDTSVEN